MELPDNIVALYEKNMALLEKMNFDPEADDPLSLCNPESYMSTGLLEPDVINTMFESNRPTQPKSIHNVAKNVGMILVRPDMTHASATFELYLRERFEILHIEDVLIKSRTYWEIYKHDFYRPETMHCRLTRAALYIDSVCRLFVFREEADEAPERALADHLCENLKGSQGVFKYGTLRGDIVYRQAVELGLHELGYKADERLRVAADPFGAYRKLARNSSGEHAGLRFPLLFYTGVGVHVPNATEIHTDLTKLLAKRDIGKF